MADLFIELQNYPLGSMGSFYGSEAQQIGTFVRESFADFSPDMRLLGPYSSPRDYLLASLKLTLDLILREECYAERPVDAYLIHNFLLDSIPKVLSAQHPVDDGQFYLKHADDKGDHILVDDDYNITGVIDWEWAHTTSKALAFKSPLFLLPVADFYDGDINPGEDELVFSQIMKGRGRQDLSDIIDWSGFLSLFKGLRRALGDHEELDWEAWREYALYRYKNDEGLTSLLCQVERN